MLNHGNKTEQTELRSASHEEAGFFYALPPEQDRTLGAIGHIRIDFGRTGTEFWHTWHPHACEALNTQEFKAEIGSERPTLHEQLLL